MAPQGIKLIKRGSAPLAAAITRYPRARGEARLSALSPALSRTPAPRRSRCRTRAVACGASASASSPAPSGGGAGGVVLSPLELQLAAFCAGFTRLFPLWVLLAAFTGFHMPELYLWFDNTCITFGLMFVMAGMGLTLTFGEIAAVFTKQPQLLLLGMVLQYTILPAFGYVISRYLMAQPGLAPGLAVGVALVSCMPGGTASNIVAFIAKGDMPLSIMMTTASTIMAIFTTPILTTLLVGTLVPVDPRAMFMSVLQLVLAPVVAGTALNQLFPAAVSRVKLYTPFMATVRGEAAAAPWRGRLVAVAGRGLVPNVVVFLIVGSMIATNVAVVASSGLVIVGAVFLLHSTGFGLGYGLSKAMGLSNKIARTNSIEVGMQSSALAAVLAKVHFADPVVVAPCVLSACTHATVGSLLAGYWAATLKEGEE
ncbi:putative sodium/metabolite cotransporter BASS1, chloroplastic [Tetrabaena socialis]|uniref:Putative sodium/metabolite cotransporter BASS1, chloroplastic n=1 Tax=Tetrabaena socialis TaxID=47790 RepID=A0A2J8AJQ4_9CHLO|nr:putative sodium/metabolite cotransporter BASS1, chloroplastic [Tetrabaena socialis]|eukprot:PNH12740.1 putative sodium/metabolite cotransporter BASS1, chloroplastic [Tetrabaena socialis]